jgi:predicted nucleic acid-binding protein
MQKNLKEFKEKEAIFIDANIFLHHAFNVNPNSVQFLKKVESSNIKAYTSVLVIEEVMFKLIMQSASNFLDKVTLQDVKAFLRDSDNREKIFKPVIEYRSYIDVLKDFGLVILDVTDKDMITALQRAKEFGLIMADAVHIGVMERKGIPYMASSDSDFRNIKNITLWSPD